MTPERSQQLWAQAVMPRTDDVDENLRRLNRFANLCQADALEEVALAEPTGWKSTLLAKAAELREQP